MAEVSPVRGGDVLRVFTLTSLRQLSILCRRIPILLTASLRAVGTGGVVAMEHVVDRAVLVIDELVSDASRHGSLPADLTVLERADRWIVVATDSAPDALPQPAVDRPVGQGGYGLHVTADLALAHGAQTGAGGKRVWVALPER